ncbi:MAG: DUF1841 family protein [Desulfobacteraceae bacterium]|nr:DUF1841 family protein [Desulfobacteraceae bacterium]
MNDGPDKMDEARRTEVYRRLWKRAKAENYEGLDGEQLRMARALRQHADLFGDFFEAYGENDSDFVEIGGEEVRPETHITLHTVIEAQLEGRDPPEVFQFYRAMRRKRQPRHEIVHCIGTILMPLISESLQRMKPFDNERYARLLRRCRSMKPERIWDRLDEIFEEDAKRYGLDVMFDEETDGPCGHCGVEGAVNEYGFCEDCGDKFERDMLRLRRWDHSLTATFLEPESYERLRLDTMEQFGENLEILTEAEAKQWIRPKKR